MVIVGPYDSATGLELGDGNLVSPSIIERESPELQGRSSSEANAADTSPAAGIEGEVPM